MNKKWLVALAIVSVLGIGWWKSREIVQPAQVEQQVRQVVGRVDFGGGEEITKVIDWQEGMTADKVLRLMDVEVVDKKYDFGIMVTSINGKENSKDRVWIYFVNGQAGDVAADQKQVSAWDMVEWKYIQPE